MKQNPVVVSYSVFIGIDVSKQWIDVAVLISGARKFHNRFDNTTEGFARMWKELKSRFSDPINQWLFCFESTGIYARQMTHFLLKNKVAAWMESGLKIKRSQGVKRGKTDKIDAYTIATYASEKHAKCQLVTPSKKNVETLQDLAANRKRLIEAINMLEVPIKELGPIDPKGAKKLHKVNKGAIKALKDSLEKVENLIDKTLEQDIELKKKFDLATSVKNVGKVLALEILITTHGFTRMMNGRKLACHAGVAPFPFQSGTTVKGKDGVSNFANMKLKSLLHMAALGAIRTNPELKKYYQRKVKDGKNKMSVINAVRNKILHRIIAVVNRNYPYIDFCPKNLVLS